MHTFRSPRSSILLLGFLLVFPVAPLSAEEAPLPSDPTTAQPTTETSAENAAPSQPSFTERLPLFAMTGQRLMNYLTNLRSSIERGKGIVETERDTILTALNKDLSYIQTEIITASKVRTESELNQRIKKVQDYWLGKQNTITYYLGLIAGGKYRRTIERFRVIETKFATLFARFEPTAELQAQKDRFTSELNKAEESYIKARDTFAKIQSPGDHAEEFKQGLEAFRQAHLHLKEARRISRVLLSSLREILGIPASEPTSTPAVQP